MKEHSRQTIYQGRTIKLEILEADLPSGKSVKREVIRHPGAVVVIAQDDKGDFILIKQFRLAIEKTILEFVAGTLEKNEEPLECAKRELIEEAGFEAKEWISLGTLYPTPGFCDELQHLFLARGLSKTKVNPDEDEIIETCVLNLNQLEESIRSGEFMDAKSMSAFLRARLQGHI